MSDNPFQAPLSSDGPDRFEASSLTRTTRRLTYIHPLSAGKVGGVLGALLTGIFAVLYGLAAIAIGIGAGEAAMVGVGAGIMIFGPIFYGIFGFIGGLLWAFIYNWVVKMGVALRFDVE